MSKQLINKNEILNVLAMESNTFEDLVDNNTISQYSYEGNIVFDVNEISDTLKINTTKQIKASSNNFRPLIVLGNKILGVLSKIIPLFYTLGKLIEMYFKGLIGA